MKTIIHILSNTLLALLMSTAVLAQLNIAVKVPAHTINKANTVCRCQVIEVTGRDNNTELVGLFAEKDKSSKEKRDTRIMDALIAKEKNYLKKGFVAKLEVLDHISADSDCMTLYYSLRRLNRKMKMHDVLNVDVLGSLAGR